jgi:hypothetical protein
MKTIGYTSPMARMGGRHGLVGMALAASVLGACSSSMMPPASEITGMHFAAVSMLPSNPPPAVDVSVGQAPAQTIYSMTLALPDLPPGVYACGPSFGIVYNLTFFDGSAIAASATLEPGGCREVLFSGSNEIRRVLDEAYWATLAQQLGVPESAIYPYLP